MLREAIPAAIRRLRADPHRVAIVGISMGGFGAFDVARHAPGRFCAVGGHSAAVWLAAGETAPGAFDDAEDFARHDLVRIARTSGGRRYGGARLWLDGATDDPFRPGDTAFAAALGIPLHHWRGEARRRLLARALRPLPALLLRRARGLLTGRRGPAVARGATARGGSPRAPTS